VSEMTPEKAREVIKKGWVVDDITNVSDFSEAKGFLAGDEYRQGEAEGLIALLKAKDDLLACYRVGKRPSEALWNRLDKGKAALTEYEKGE